MQEPYAENILYHRPVSGIKEFMDAVDLLTTKMKGDFSAHMSCGFFFVQHLTVLHILRLGDVNPDDAEQYCHRLNGAADAVIFQEP